MVCQRRRLLPAIRVVVVLCVTIPLWLTGTKVYVTVHTECRTRFVYLYRVLWALYRNARAINAAFAEVNPGKPPAITPEQVMFMRQVMPTLKVPCGITDVNDGPALGSRCARATSSLLNPVLSPAGVL